MAEWRQGAMGTVERDRVERDRSQNHGHGFFILNEKIEQKGVFFQLLTCSPMSHHCGMNVTETSAFDFGVIYLFMIHNTTHLLAT